LRGRCHRGLAATVEILAIAPDVNNGKFDFAGVTPGSYRMRVIRPNEPISGEMPIELTDHDLDGLVCHAIPPITVKGAFGSKMANCTISRI